MATKLTKTITRETLVSYKANYHVKNMCLDVKDRPLLVTLERSPNEIGADNSEMIHLRPKGLSDKSSIKVSIRDLWQFWHNLKPEDTDHTEKLQWGKDGASLGEAWEKGYEAGQTDLQKYIDRKEKS